MKKGRSDKAIRNTSIAIIIHIANVLLKFGVRFVFIKTLGKEYLGVNGVFSSIISILSLAEMGLGTAIIYDMYKPAEENDYQRLNALICLFKRIYNIVGLVILVGGLICLPFLRFLIKEVPNVKYIKIIYLLFIIDSSLSYLFAHNKSYLDVYQEGHVHIINTFIFDVAKSVIQVVFLFLTHFYISFLIIQIVFNFISGLVLKVVVKQKHPHYCLRNQAQIEASDRKKILKNATSIMSIKIGSTLISSGDNIILSLFVNTIAVGLYSNYALIISAVQSTLFSAVNALLPSIGNLFASGNKERYKSVFGQLMYVYSFAYCFSSVCIILATSDFILLAFGSSYILDEWTVIFASLSFYIGGVIQVLQNFNTVNGMFVHFRIKPWVEAAVNVIISIVFVKSFGIGGVFAGTVVARISTSVWYDSYVLYKYCFKEKPIEYYKYFSMYLLQFIVIAVLSILLRNGLSRLIGDSLILRIFLSLFIGSVIAIVGQLLMNIKNENQKQIIKLGINKLKGRKNGVS